MANKKYEEIKKEIEKLGGVLLSKEYINNSTPLEILCPICKEGIATKTYSNIQQRKNCMCKKCSYEMRAKERIAKKHREMDEYIKSIGGVLLEYKGKNKEMKLLCTKCKKEFYKQVQSVRYNDNPYCFECNYEMRANIRRTDINIIRDFIKELGGELVSEKFVRSTDNLVVKCNVCKQPYERTWKYIKDNENVTCPKCSNIKSKGELKIMKILDENNIEYITEKTFDDCVDVGKLRYDFYIPEMNLCIEYDGKQHYFEYNDFGGTESFIDRKRKDEIKTQYCKDNNINLLRISFKQFRKIEEILIQNKIIPSQAS